MMTVAEILGAVESLDRADVLTVLTVCAARLAGGSSTSAEPADELLTVEQAADRLQYARSYLYELIKRGDIAVVRHDKLIRIKRSALDEFVSRHEMCGPLPAKVVNIVKQRKP